MTNIRFIRYWLLVYSLSILGGFTHIVARQADLGARRGATGKNR